MFTVLFLFSLLVVHNSAQVVGLWYWTWGDSVRSPPEGATHGFAFDGTVLPDCITNSESIKGKLTGARILTIGGGTTKWTQPLIDSQTRLIGTVKPAGYVGVAIDIEEGEVGLSFTALFAAVKAEKLQLWVTISHSSPYGILDASVLMAAILSNPNVDYISPQLYSSGTESEPDFTALTVLWSQYVGIHAKVVPSLPSGSMYEATFCFFKKIGITLGGYIQWQQAGYVGSGPSKVPTCTTPTPSPTNTLLKNACGTTWATTSCSRLCPKGTNAECPDGQSCYANIACAATGTGTGTGKFNACGADWGAAVTKGCSATPCPNGLDSECPKNEHCYAGVPCASAANSAVVTTEKNADGSTTTTTRITTSEGIPGYGVALLCIAVLVIVVLVILIALLTSKKQSERV